MNGFQIIDQENWKRAVHCQVFRNYVEPAYCITYEVDITNFIGKLRARRQSFTYSMIYAVTACANAIEEFRYRFVDGQVVLFDKIDTAFTCMNEETELFKVVNAEWKGTMEEYAAMAKAAAENQKEYFTGPLGNDIFQFSPLPWISYTHISHTNSGKKDNATPLFDWGRYTERDGRVLLAFSIQAHHSFVDGYHMGKLAESLQRYLDEYGTR